MIYLKHWKVVEREKSNVQFSVNIGKEIYIILLVTSIVSGKMCSNSFLSIYGKALVKLKTRCLPSESLGSGEDKERLRFNVLETFHGRVTKNKRFWAGNPTVGIFTNLWLHILKCTPIIKIYRNMRYLYPRNEQYLSKFTMASYNPSQ